MSEFTKGPWYKSKPKGEHRAFVMCKGVRVCTVAYNGGKMNTSANANLIAAAPDMYEEIQRDVENLKQLLCDMDDSSLEFAATLRKIDRKTKLLAKARGEL